MIKLANAIRRIEISSLWSGHKHIVWNLRPDVNVLSGRNGAGKSTILNKLVQHLRTIPLTGELSGSGQLGVKVDFDPADATGIRYDVLRSFDRKILVTEPLGGLTDARIVTELDWQLYLVQRRYLDYQVNVGNRMIQLLTGGDPDAREKATEAAALKARFLDMVDELFAETGKRIDRQSNELAFVQYGEKLSPYILSSGEKQMLLILLTVLTEDRQPHVLFMDEPEASLHFEWQKSLISMVRELNPHAQVLLTTHSPALIMNGWEDAVTEVSDITVV
ncbi:MAG: AAA family ATPase [Bacteroidales bacterium]|nr:AAA family ATPase [Bacteroidales bacterium]